MAEYIDREAAIKAVSENDCEGYATWAVKAVPAADVRPVVLCGECKRYGGRPWEKNETGICARTDSGVREDDFCSYGERREES